MDGSAKAKTPVKANTACWMGKEMVRILKVYIPEPCKACKETGIDPENKKCEKCEGKGVVERECSACKGNKKVKSCKVCGGTRIVQVKCRQCKGTGKVLCGKCYGDGLLKIPVSKSKHKGPVTCDYKSDVRGLDSAEISEFVLVQKGDMAVITGSGHDKWAKAAFAPNTPVQICVVDHSDARLPVRVAGPRKDGEEIPRWLQSSALKRA